MCGATFPRCNLFERREQLRPLLRAAADAEALKRGASLEEVSRLHDELTRCPRASAQASQPAHGPLLRSRNGRGAPGGELRDAPREA